MAKEISRLIYNLTDNSSPETLSKVYNLGVLVMFLDWLSIEDNEIVSYCLRTIQNLLMFGNYTKEMNNYNSNFVKEEILQHNEQKMILKHQFSKNKEIYELVGDILDNYFAEEEQENEL